MICFSIALWNGRDPILKERLFGLTGHEGNHGEDVKEYYFYLDTTPTHSYMKYLYKYPQAAFPYAELVEKSRQRSRREREYELLDTGIFDEDRYFDVFVEYAKASAEDILIRVTVINRGAEESYARSAADNLVPQHLVVGPRCTSSSPQKRWPATECGNDSRQSLRNGDRWLLCELPPELLFTDNETNFKRLFGAENYGRYVKDGINDYVVSGDKEAVNREGFGTKARLATGFRSAAARRRQ